MHEAKTHLSRLLEDVAAGTEVVITRRGAEVARLVPPAADKGPQFGADRGKIVMRDDFDAPLPDDIRDAFGA